VPKLTAERVEIITQHINDCNIWRLTAEETAQYLALRGFPLDARTVKKYRSKIRKSAGEWIARLAVSKRNDYIHEYKERTDTIRLCERELWAINNKKIQTPADKIRIEALAKIMECTKILTDLYERVPVLAAIRQTADYQQQQPEKELT
jgi:hypothetical protein